jgi:hypothetical protein
MHKKKRWLFRPTRYSNLIQVGGVAGINQQSPDQDAQDIGLNGRGMLGIRRFGKASSSHARETRLSMQAVLQSSICLSLAGSPWQARTAQEPASDAWNEWLAV